MQQETNAHQGAAAEMPEGATLAALDLGSNSFHLIVAKVEHQEMRPIETLTEKVQLGAGLKNDLLDTAAMERGLACLARFKQVLNSVEPFRTRVVGTHTLRRARNRHEFTQRAEQLLGVNVEVIYGREEARLIYLGVAHTLADDETSRLVVDIGGGSTEFIVGQRFEPISLDSLQTGCVSFTRKYFKNGKISPTRYRRAYEAVRVAVSHIRSRYHTSRWQDCVGSSGTLRSIEAILLQYGWSKAGISREGLARLEQALLNFQHMDDLELEGLSDNRRNVIVAGVAISAGIFDELGIRLMRSSWGALREGVIYDLLGRMSHEDVRERTISAMMQRYNVDAEAAETVQRRCHFFYRCSGRNWKLGRSDWDLLRWAARTHEIGMAISHKHFNRHGAYLLRNADLPGFSQGEQEIMAMIVQHQRGKISKTDLVRVPPSDRLPLLRKICLLRLASLFKYVEQLERLPEFRVEADGQSLQLQFPERWLQQHPLTKQELREEKTLLKRVGIKLEIC